MTEATACNEDVGSVSFFRKSWGVYDALVECNYMFHREIYAAVEAWLVERRDLSSGAFLDLGCGNARIMRRCFEAAPPSSYTGIDLSTEALTEARDHLSGLPRVELIQTDMLSFLEGGAAVFDVIFSGFAVHHLDRGGKQRLFEAVARRLGPGGAFLLVDVARAANETRDEAVAAYIDTMREEWTRLEPDDLENACAHVAAFDFPEPFGALAEMARKAGLNQSQGLAAFGRHEAAVFAVGSP